MKIKIRKWLPSYVTVTYHIAPKRGKTARYNRAKFKRFDAE